MLKAIAGHIGQFVFKILIDQIPVCCQGIAGAAGPAVQIYRSSGFQYLKLGPALPAMQKIRFHVISCFIQ